MALSADIKITRQEGQVLGLPVKGTTKVYGGGLVAVDSTGYALPAADTAGLKFRGIARHQADNSSGGDGDKQIEVWTGGVFELTVVSTLAQTDLGRPVFVKDDSQVDLKTGNFIKVGRIVEIVSANKAMVRLDLEIDEEFQFYVSLPVAAGAILTKGDMIARNAAGYVLPAADLSTLTFTGMFAAFDANNSGGSNGEIDVVAEAKDHVRIQCTSSPAAGNLGATVYVQTATTVGLATTNSRAVGKIAQVIDSTWLIVAPAAA